MIKIKRRYIKENILNEDDWSNIKNSIEFARVAPNDMTTEQIKKQNEDTNHRLKYVQCPSYVTHYTTDIETVGCIIASGALMSSKKQARKGTISFTDDSSIFLANDNEKSARPLQYGFMLDAKKLKNNLDNLSNLEYDKYDFGNFHATAARLTSHKNPEYPEIQALYICIPRYQIDKYGSYKKGEKRTQEYEYGVKLSNFRSPVNISADLYWKLDAAALTHLENRIPYSRDKIKSNNPETIFMKGKESTDTLSKRSDSKPKKLEYVVCEKRTSDDQQTHFEILYDSTKDGVGYKEEKGSNGGITYRYYLSKAEFEELKEGTDEREFTLVADSDENGNKGSVRFNFLSNPSNAKSAYNSPNDFMQNTFVAMIIPSELFGDLSTEQESTEQESTLSKIDQSILDNSKIAIIENTLTESEKLKYKEVSTILDAGYLATPNDFKPILDYMTTYYSVLRKPKIEKTKKDTENTFKTDASIKQRALTKSERKNLAKKFLWKCYMIYIFKNRSDFLRDAGCLRLFDRSKISATDFPELVDVKQTSV